MSKRAFLRALAILPLLSACTGILGIEQATHDPALDEPRGGGGQPGDSGGAPKTPCEEYCATALRNCAGANSLYASSDACLAVCNTFPAGTAGADSGNSLACRMKYAKLAGTVGELDINCPAAGPGGDGVCGTNCEGFCTIALAACPTSTVVNVDSCAGLCARLPDQGGYDASIQKGNSVQCRLYHASAATLDPVVHCPHVAGVGPCSATSTP
ncbi:MAG TPA: hypothetical protein VHE30_10670 [Polyangiaceae bacterium]|nr:hypothetical protein [Polyangiaceae bacterium]